MDQLTEFVTRYGETVLSYFSQPSVLIQVGLIVFLYVVALLVAKLVEPRLEEQARKIKNMPGLLRLIVALLRRLRWLFFSMLLAAAYLSTSVAGVLETTYLLYSVMLLAGAWLLISVVSHVMRNRAVGKMFAIIAWTYVAAVILGVSGEIAAMLDAAGFSVGNRHISVLYLVKSTLFVGVLLWASMAIGNFAERRIQSVDELTPSLRVLIGKVVRITLLVLVVLIAMSALGLDITALTVLSGAIGVGIGFGLQKVVSNFISGIIILMDQSIKPGDTISLGETFGWIRELRARFVSVVTRDGREFLVPNEDFITREVINWSFSDQYVRLDVPFGVSYSSDPHEVTRLAIEAAGSVERVNSSHTPPVCWMTEFGDSSINFLLRFWISDPQKGLTNIRGQVLLALWDSFKANGINIPFPHREVIMKTPVELQTPVKD